MVRTMLADAAQWTDLMPCSSRSMSSKRKTSFESEEFARWPLTLIGPLRWEQVKLV